MYKIVRFYKDVQRSPRTMSKGLTLQEAQAHCRREDTRGMKANIVRDLKKARDEGWFDAYTKE